MYTKVTIQGQEWTVTREQLQRLLSLCTEVYREPGYRIYSGNQVKVLLAAIKPSWA